MRSITFVRKSLGVAVFYVVFGISQVSAQACCALPGVEAAETNVTLIDYDTVQQNFSVPTLDGGTFTLSDQLGKPVVLFAMAYWCGTCISEAEALSRLYEEYVGQGLGL